MHMIFGVTALISGLLMGRSPSVDPIASQSNRLGVRLVQDISQKDLGNILVSPASIYIALGSLDGGARGQTKTVMDAALGLDSTPNSSLDQLSEFNQSLKRSQVVTVANSLWTAPTLQIDPAYRAMVAAKFQMTASPLIDLGARGTAQVNGWVNKNTSGLIPKLIHSLSPETRLLLINAISFDGKWQIPFKARQTVQGDFHGLRQTADVPFMARTGVMDYGMVGKNQVLRLPYQNGLSMILSLPPEGTDPSTALEALGPLQSFTPSVVKLRLPKFKFAAEYELSKPLSHLGLGPIFEAANLTGISPLFIPSRTRVSQVIHKTIVEIDEAGTKAAAVTGIVIVRSAMPVFHNPIALNFDHPFGFAIQDDKTGADLFLGVVRNLSAG